MLFKDIYNKEFFELFTNAMKSIKPNFDIASFINCIYDDEWDSRELKQRMRHITVVLKNHLDKAYKECAYL